jgi:hypothetical protein
MNGWQSTARGSTTSAPRLTGPFRRTGDPAIGVALTAAAVPLWMHLSLLEECRGRVEQALAAVAAGAGRDAQRKVKLLAALGTSLVYTGGAVPEIGAAWTKALEIAESLGDTEYQLRSLFGLWCLSLRQQWASRRSDPGSTVPSLNHAKLIWRRLPGISGPASATDLLTAAKHGSSVRAIVLLSQSIHAAAAGASASRSATSSVIGATIAARCSFARRRISDGRPFAA